jgi:fructosamine-3-kinase
VDALNTWWKEFSYSAPPVKAGTVTPAHTITSKNGRVYNIPKHVQTKKEAEDEAEDARYMEHKRTLVQGFSVKGQTVTVLTNLTRNPVDISDAKELCHDLGAFVWANQNRHFGLQGIKVTDARGELLSSRVGLGGQVQ